MAAFQSGFGTGVATMDRAFDRRQRRDIAEEELGQRRTDSDRRWQLEKDIEARQRKESESRLLTDEAERKRQEEVRRKIEIENRVLEDEMRRYAEAEEALRQFHSAEELIDWGDPLAIPRYQAITRQYLPGIQKHEATFKKYQAHDKVTQENAAFTTKKLHEIGVQYGYREGAQIAPGYFLSLPKLPDGSTDFRAVDEELQRRRKELFQEELELRKASRTGRGNANLGSNPAIRAEVSAAEARLKSVGEEIIRHRSKTRPTDKDRAKLQELMAMQAKEFQILRALQDRIQGEGESQSGGDGPDDDWTQAGQYRIRRVR